MTSFVQLFLEDYGKTLDEKAKHYLGFISKSSNHMKNLVSDLLEFSRIGKVKVITTFSWKDIVQEALNELETEVETSGATIEIGEIPAMIKGYQMEIRLLFLNLISNAIKFRKKNTVLMLVSTSHWRNIVKKRRN